jgi:hypothetical protein
LQWLDSPWLPLFVKPPPEAGLIKFQVNSAESDASLMAISPDGREFAFRSPNREGKSLLWLRSLDQIGPKPLPGTEDGFAPFFSPDGKSLGFFAEDKLKKIALDSLSVQVLGNAHGLTHDAWSPRGVIVFAPRGKGMQRISAAGGTPQPIYSLDKSKKEFSQGCPVFLEDGQRFLFWSWGPTGLVEMGSLDGAPPKVIFEQRDSFVQYVPGRLGKAAQMLFVRGDQLLAQSFDTRKGQLTGEPLVITHPVGLGFWASGNGVLIYRPSPPYKLTWVNRDGKELGVPTTQIGGCTISIATVSPGSLSIPDTMSARCLRLTGATLLMHPVSPKPGRSSYGLPTVLGWWKRCGEAIYFQSVGRAMEDGWRVRAPKVTRMSWFFCRCSETASRSIFRKGAMRNSPPIVHGSLMHRMKRDAVRFSYAIRRFQGPSRLSSKSLRPGEPSHNGVMTVGAFLRVE